MPRRVRFALGVILLCAATPLGAAPNDAAEKQALLDRGIADKAKRDFDAAIADFGRAIAADPKWGVAYEFRGSAFAAKAEASEDPGAAADLLDKAVADYDTAIRLGEATARAFTLRGVAASDKEDFKRAIADFDRALKLDANFILATRMRDYATEQLHEQDRQIALDGDLLRFQPRNIDLLLSRAALLLRQGRGDEAREDIDKVLAIDPNNEAALAERDEVARAASTTAAPGAKP